ncbi:2OG-Fe(II) oxygenase [Maricaulis sp. CAU 1757]
MPVFDIDSVCDDLAGQGWSVCQLADPSLPRTLFAEADQRHRAGQLSRAGIGRSDEHGVESRIRRDRTRWLDRDSAAEAAWLDFAEDLRLAINARLMLGLFAFEAHFAVYEPGAFYARHRDSFRGARNRILSSVLYLNEDWHPDEGGALRLYADDDDAATVLADIQPHMAHLALFLSEDIPHEVLPARRARYSIAGWHRCNDRALAPALQARALPLAI